MNPKERQISSTEDGVAVAEPIEIFPGQQEIQPAFLKTPKMLEVERVIGNKLPEFLETKYSVQGLSPGDISRSITAISDGDIQLTPQSVSDWLNRFNIPLRSMSKAAKLAWQDPDKRKRRIERIHSPTADGKRSKAMRRNWHSLSKLEKRDRVRGVIEGRRRAMLRRMRETLGEDPTERLKEMCSRLSSAEIGENLGVSRSTVIRWNNLRNTIRKPGESTQGIGFIKANEESKRELIKKARAFGLMEMLDAKEQYVIYARFPIEGDRIKSHVEIGRSLYPDRPKINRQWPQQIERRALRKLAAMQETA